MKKRKVQKFCDVLKKLEHMSAMGQGKELRSSLAEYLEKRDLRVMAICGHRKTGYISGVAGRWLENFRLDYDSYNLRMRRALEGRGSHSFQHYKARGEAFAAPSLVVFVLAICGGFETIVQPANLRSQDAADLPMERWSAWSNTAKDLRAVAAQIRGVRAFLRRMFLIAPYLADEPAPFRRYWFCFALSPNCKLLHARGRWCLPMHLFPIFFEGKFQECELPLRVRPSTGTTKLYHPACQCVAHAQVPRVERRNGMPEWLAGGPVETRNWERLVLVLRCQTNAVAAQWKTDLSMMTPLAPCLASPRWHAYPGRPSERA